MIGTMNDPGPAQVEALADVLLNMAEGGVEDVSLSRLSGVTRVLCEQLCGTLHLRAVIDWGPAQQKSIDAVVWIKGFEESDDGHRFKRLAHFIAAQTQSPVVMVEPDGDVEYVPWAGGGDRAA